MRVSSAIFIAAIAVSVVVCIYALVLTEGADFKLALAAYSACLASFSAWQFKWRAPNVEPIGAIYPEGTDRKQGMLYLFNEGAFSTLFRIMGAESVHNGSQQYEFTQAMHPIAGHSSAAVKVTLAAGDPLVRDKVCIKYAFCRGVRIVIRTAHITWEGASHVIKT